MRWAGAKIDAAPVQVFRVGLGVLLAAMPIRFAAHGWIESLFLEPSFHFPWLSWAVVPSAPVLYGMHAAMVLAGLAIARGRLYRPALAVYLGVFGYLELLDKTLYLNHYVLISMVLLTLLFLPFHPGAPRTPRWALGLLQAEFGLVWFWAGVCKLNGDWLLRAEPLHTWLHARMELPVVGPLLGRWETALAMSWGGMLFDLSIVFLLLWGRTRVFGFVLLVGFHTATAWLFPIGVFPWVMGAGGLLFLPASTIARLRGTVALPPTQSPTPRWVTGLLAAVLALLVLTPIRHVLYPGYVNWNERGFRFSWRVMLIEKTGQVDYRVVDRDSGHSWTVNPRDELTELQHAQMRTQPDMIVDYARHLAARNAAEGRRVEVYAESFASLNGRPSQRLIRRDVELGSGLPLRSDWIEPLR